MKAHTGAKVLNELARILREAPNADISELRLEIYRRRSELTKDEIALNITTLLGLSKVSKRTWADFIRENAWPIDVKDRDSSRNLIGRILRYLDEHPEAQERLKKHTAARAGRASSELQSALSSLLDLE